MTNKEIFLETAERIGERLVKNAVWDNSYCTWYVMTPDRENKKSREAKKTLANGTVYQGTAGILLFLSALYKISPCVDLKKVIKGAVNYSLREANKLANNNFGFYSGRVGISYAVVKTAKALNENSYLNKAIKIIEPLKGNESLDEGIDVISGAAGAIPALLQMEQIFRNNICFDMAIALGESLIYNANMEPTGWTWGSSSKSNFRHLLGYAHGTSGIGHAFLELYNTTNSNYYLYAAEQAFLYERQFYDKESSNWPDFRFSELSQFVYTNEIDELKTALVNKTLKPYSPKYMNAWCHGAPGIGLSRIRVYQLTKSDVYLKEAKNAIKSTITSLINMKNINFSLCHGIGGNCETLIYSSEVLESNSNYEIAQKYGLIGYENFEKYVKCWPCGTQQSVSDPSLMLGEAGIGYFYLRLFSKKVPSLLVLTTESNNKKVKKHDYKMIQKKYIYSYFGKTLTIINKTLPFHSEKFGILDFEIGTNISDIVRTYKIITKYFRLEKSSKKMRLLKDLSQIEIKKYELSFKLTEYYQEFTDELIKENSENIEWENILIKLNSNTKILKINSDKKTILLYRYQNKIYTQELIAFPLAVLKLIGKGNSFVNILNGISRLLSNSEDNLQNLKPIIIKQLKEMYIANFIITEKNSNFM